MNVVKKIKASVEELRKVSWPNKDEVVRASVAVCVFVAIFSGILFGVDVLARLGLQELMR